MSASGPSGPLVMSFSKFTNYDHCFSHNIQETQWVSPFLTGDHKAARHIHCSMAKTNTNL